VRLAYAVVRDEPPVVILAENIDVLNRSIAIRLIAQTPAHTLTAGDRTELRAALLEGRWGDAVARWIAVTDVPVDVYDDIEVNTDETVSADTTAIQIQLAPLFED
jgi:hypothetical protein